MKFLTDQFFKNKTKVVTLLLLPACLLFLKSLFFDFTTLDEQWMIVHNVPFLKTWGSIPEAFTRSLNHNYYRPLFMITLLLDYHLGRLFPFIYHLTNLLLHLTAVYLLFQFLTLVTKNKKLAFIYSVLFSVHPIILHAVAWIPGRNDTLLCVFTLSALISLYQFILTRQLKHGVFHFIFFCCALFTKENAIVLPLIFMSIYFIVMNGERKKGYVLSLVWIVLSTLFLIVRNKIVSPVEMIDQHLFSNPLNFIAALFVFAGKAVLPIYQSILPVIKSPTVVLGCLVVLVSFLLIIKPGLKDKKTAFLGLFIFFILLLIPAWFGAFKSNGEHYEHRSYTSLIGLFLFLTQVKFKTESILFTNIVVIVFCFFFVKSFVRMNVYKNKELFVDSGLKDRPDFYLFYVQKGEILYEKRDFIQADVFFSKAIEIRPDKGHIYNQRGSARFSMRRYPEAIRDFTDAIQKSAFKADYYLNRCMAYDRADDVKDAMLDLQLLKKCCQNEIPISLEYSITKKWEAVKSVQ